MLTPEFLHEAPEGLLELYRETEEAILADMARRISTYDFYIPAAQWQKRKLEAMGMMESEINRRLSQLTGRSLEEIKELMKEAGMETIANDDRIHTIAGKKCPPLEASPSLIAVMNSGYRRTAKAFRNLTRSTAANASKQFSKILDQAYMQVISGAFDTETAIRNAIKALAEKGIDSVRYPSGRVDSMEVAVRRAIVTGINQTAGDMQLARAEDVDSEYVETTAHAGARPEHEVWQGKVFKLRGEEPGYPNFYEATGYGTGPGLCGYNCRHNFSPFYPGLSTPAYSEEMLVEYAAKDYLYNGKKYTEYEVSQMQRYYERARRRWKREYLMQEAAGLDTAEASVKMRSYMEKLKDLEEQTRMPSQHDRMIVAGFGKGEAGKSQWEARKYYQWFRKAYSLEGQGMRKTLASYYDMKYNNPPEYKLFKKYVLSVERGEVSPLLGLSTYRETARQIDEQLVGLRTPQGVEIKDYSSHFVGRMIGHSAPNKKYNRTGVSIEDLKHCITHGEERTSGHEDTIMLVGSGCQVTYNPKTGVLVQTNRKDREV
nr:MAG TPA: minor capsid protein [Caudoviricetes sp.]